MKKIITRTAVLILTCTLGLFAFWATVKIYPPIPDIAEPDEETTISIHSEHCYPSFNKLSYSEPLADSPVSLLLTGRFWADEVTAKTGERWMAVFPSKNGEKDRVFLREEKISVRLTGHPTDEDSLDGKEVKIKGRGEPLFLVKGLKQFSLGRIKTVFVAKQDAERGYEGLYFKGGDSKNFRLGERNYTLFIETQSPESNVVPDDAQLMLASEGHSQILHLPGPMGGDATIELQWAGDLDGDGRLDLYLVLNTHYNNLIHTLYLSSFASEGELVAPVANFYMVGC